VGLLSYILFNFLIPNVKLQLILEYLTNTKLKSIKKIILNNNGKSKVDRCESIIFN